MAVRIACFQDELDKTLRPKMGGLACFRVAIISSGIKKISGIGTSRWLWIYVGNVSTSLWRYLSFSTFLATSEAKISGVAAIVRSDRRKTGHI
ncbi:hypothetical protein Tco_0564696 [Tanacetum coccineum]